MIPFSVYYWSVLDELINVYCFTQQQLSLASGPSLAWSLYAKTLSVCQPMLPLCSASAAPRAAPAGTHGAAAPLLASRSSPCCYIALASVDPYVAVKTVHRAMQPLWSGDLHWHVFQWSASSCLSWLDHAWVWTEPEKEQWKLATTTMNRGARKLNLVILRRTV